MLFRLFYLTKMQHKLHRNTPLPQYLLAIDFPNLAGNTEHIFIFNIHLTYPVLMNILSLSQKYPV